MPGPMRRYPALSDKDCLSLVSGDSRARGVRNTVHRAKNQLVNITTGSQNTIRPFHANGPDFVRNPRGPTSVIMNDQMLKYPNHRGKNGESDLGLKHTKATGL